MKITPIDFETVGIESRPDYPPKSVGVALVIDRKYEYLSWGHPSENNCNKREATKILKEQFRTTIPVFHDAGFDIGVAVAHHGCNFPSIDFHDTLFLAYLNDPREKTLSLKPLADKYLNMRPTEQSKLKKWILENVFEAQGWKETKNNPWGKYICLAPGNLVGKYAIGDIRRTKKLCDYFMPSILSRGMLEAYEREKRCLPLFEDMSNTGLKVDGRRLKRDLKVWTLDNEKRGSAIRKKLKTPDLDLNSSPQVADAMDKTGKVSEWIYTAKGNRSTARDNLYMCCDDKKLVALMADYAVMNTYISTFAKPWLDSYENKNGRIYPGFNQVRSPEDWSGRSGGTKTGRPSSNNPNLLNVPRNQKSENLPNMRNYILPDDGCVFIIRDYSQQELRIAAHFEKGVLYNSYMADPTMDAHVKVQALIKSVARLVVDRAPVKTINFGKLYGMGKGAVANKLMQQHPPGAVTLEQMVEEAVLLIAAHEKALPGLKELNRKIQRHAKQGNAIYTWGGREYYVEDRAKIDGQWRTFYYKLLNYLIQGSGADCTKEAMIRSDAELTPIGGRVALQVYDEIAACVPKKHAKHGMQLLKNEMESVEFDVPMLTDGKLGRKSWGEAVKYVD